MIIILSIFTIIEFAIIFYFVGNFFSIWRQNTKDINAIATRLRAIEDTVQIRDAATSFRLSVLEKSVLDIGDTGFNLDGLKIIKKAPQ